MGAIELILEILIILLSLVIIVAVALQKSKSEGITGVTATSETDNYFGKNKELAGDAKLSKITKIALIIFVAVSLLITILFAMEANLKQQEEKASEVTETAEIVLVQEA